MSKRTYEVTISLVIGSGCTNYMIKDRDLFVDLNDSFGGTISNANEWE